MATWILLLAVALTMTASGFVQSALGFGYAIVALAILPYVLDIRAANVVVSLSVILPTILAVRAYRNEIDWSAVAYSLVGALVGLPIGLFIFSTINPDWLVRGTGVAILLLALDGPKSRRTDAEQQDSSRWWSAVAGGASGLLSGSIGMGGPPVVAYAVRQPWTPNRMRAFLVTFLLISAICRGIGLAVCGWVTQQVLFYALATLPFALLGCQLGIRLARDINAQNFRIIMTAVLVCLSLGMIVRGQPPRHDETASPSTNGAQTTIDDAAATPPTEPGN